MMKMKISMQMTTDTIREYFKFYKEYVPNPPDKEIQGWILHHLKNKSFNTILLNYGIRYLLIVLSMLEDFQNFQDCSKVLELINNYNKYYGRKYPTHIKYLKPQKR